MILEYIRASIEILMNLKIEDHELEVEEKVKSRVKNIVAKEEIQWAEAPKDYERIIQKLEVSCVLTSLCLLGRSAQSHFGAVVAQNSHRELPAEAG